MRFINPWFTVWFQPRKTAAWAKNNQPLFGVLVLLVLHVLVTFLVPYVSPVASEPKEVLTTAHRAGVLIDVWLMPVVLLFVLYAVGLYMRGDANLSNILWVLVWSQLPIIILSVVTVVLKHLGLQTTEPLFVNKITYLKGVPVLDPPMLAVNTHAVIYFLISTVPLLWSFQILLSGFAAVESVTLKRAMWMLTVAMIVLMLIRLPVTLVLGDRDLLDILGLKGIVELQ